MSSKEAGPGDRVLLPREVEERTRLSGATIFRLRRRGEFPAPLVLGLKRVAYLESEIDAWLSTRRRASYPGEAA